MDAVEATRLWIDNQVRLKAFSLDTSPAYILQRQLPTGRSIGRCKHKYNPGYKLLVMGFESWDRERINAKVIKVLRWLEERGSQSEGFDK